MTATAPRPNAPAPTTTTRATGVRIGRIPVTRVAPVVEGGAYPAKAALHEELPIRACVFREGHDAVAASAILTSPSGRTLRQDLTQVEPIGLDRWEAWVRPDEEGLWTFRVEGWSDPWHTWLHHADAKLPGGIDVELVCLEGKQLLERTAAEGADARLLAEVAAALDPARDTADLLATAHRADLARVMAARGPRDLVSPTPEYPFFVDRPRASFSAWYEFFPRSQGATFDAATRTWTSGTFDSSHAALEHAARMGFDVVYLPPIHPIGTSFRKGPNNAAEAAAGDPGSTWAIGGPEGGHDAIHPDLGDEAAFERFVAKAKSLGLEVAIDFALQASPEHPWLAEHPEWFAKRPDGTIAYAENPPKKYQDIYPINFDEDPAGIGREVLRILRLWISRGVTIIRVDNPHTKPVDFWAWLLAEVRRTNPEVIFLAEAFTRPELMQTLGKVGFHLSYTYFTWRNTKAELVEYVGQLQEYADYYRPSFWPNTPDINAVALHSGNPAAFAIRAALAALLSPSWGIYSGYEFFEHELFRAEEYLNSEKYEYRPRDLDQRPSLTEWIATLNRLRNAHPALQQLRRTTFHETGNDRVLCFSKANGDDVVIGVVSLDPDGTQEATLSLDLAALGLAGRESFPVRDEVSGEDWQWGAHPFVRLTPGRPVHLVTLSRS